MKKYELQLGLGNFFKELSLKKYQIDPKGGCFTYLFMEPNEDPMRVGTLLAI